MMHRALLRPVRQDPGAIDVGEHGQNSAGNDQQSGMLSLKRVVRHVD